MQDLTVCQWVCNVSNQRVLCLHLSLCLSWDVSDEAMCLIYLCLKVCAWCIYLTRSGIVSPGIKQMSAWLRLLSWPHVLTSRMPTRSRACALAQLLTHAWLTVYAAPPVLHSLMLAHLLCIVQAHDTTPLWPCSPLAHTVWDKLVFIYQYPFLSGSAENLLHCRWQTLK